MTQKNRRILGLTENVKILNREKEINVLAKIDSGATKSSIDSCLVNEMKLGPVVETRLVKTAHGAKVRPVIKVNIELEGKKVEAKFTIADRHHMNYKMLIGLNILKKEGFLIDPCKR